MMKNINILLVEDNINHATLIKNCFEREQDFLFNIHHVDDGEKALEYLFQTNEYSKATDNIEPDLILLDLRLPKYNGFEVLKKIKNSNELKKIPVIILTTSDLEIDIKKAYSYHANSVLTKPVNFDDFCIMIKEFCNYWIKWNNFL